MAATKTIEDYKRDYELAKALGDAAGMKAANDGANALRAAAGQELEYATVDINNVAGYTPLNATSAPGIDYSSYENEVAKQQEYISANPSAAQTMSRQEKYDKYGDIIDSTVQTGYYTRDYAAAKAAADQYGVTVTPTSYNGEEGWYLVDKAQRTTQAGSSGADEGLLSDTDYAIVQSLKQDFADAQSGYKQAMEAGDTILAAHYQALMDNAHLEAERIRAGYGYSGGQDGSMYITSGALEEDDDWDSGGNSSGSLSAGGSHVSGGNSAVGGGTVTGGGVSMDGIWDTGSLTVPGLADLSGQVEDYSAYLQQMYAAQKAAALAELKAAYEKNVNELNRAEAGVAGQYQAARNQTAGASEQLKRNFAQYAAANGLNNGTAGQAELARSVTLQNNLNTINAEEANTVADLQLQRANAEVEYNNAIAQAEAGGDYELAAALYEEKVRVQEALIELEIQEQQYALKQYQLQYQAQRDQVDDRLQKYLLEYQTLRDSVGDNQWAQELELAWQKYLASLA